MNPWLVSLIGVAALAAIVVLAILLWRLSRAAAEAEQFLAHLNQMSPRLERILAETESELAEVRKITQKASDVATPALDGAGALTKPMRYITAAVAGVQAVMQMWRSRKKDESEQPESPVVEA